MTKIPASAFEIKRFICIVCACQADNARTPKEQMQETTQNKIKKVCEHAPQMGPKSTLQRLTEPFGTHFGYKVYFKTLLELVFHGFGVLLGTPWDLLGERFHSFFLSRGSRTSRCMPFWAVRFRMTLLL